ncbi:MAG: hypothetical protein H5T76_13870 [Streptomyces sp.]|nr:hypothetical protein [Streptomyces sp.]
MTDIRPREQYGQALDALQHSLPDEVTTAELAGALARLIPRAPASSAVGHEGYADAVRVAISLTLYAVRDHEPRPGTEGGDKAARKRGWQKVRSSPHDQAAPTPVRAAPAAPAAARVSVAKVLQGFRDALEAADALAATPAPTPAPAEPVPWSDDEELIDLLHDVLAAGVRGRDGFALARIADLAETLAARGIETVSYDPEADGPAGDPALFEFVDGARPGRTGTMLAPALIDVTAGTRTLRRGRVRAAPAVPGGAPDARGPSEPDAAAR